MLIDIRNAAAGFVQEHIVSFALGWLALACLFGFFKTLFSSGAARVTVVGKDDPDIVGDHPNLSNIIRMPRRSEDELNRRFLG